MNKEREAFEKECRLLCYKGNMVMSSLGSFYNNEQTNWMWQMWLSAKNQAVPEGFVLISKNDLKMELCSIRHLNSGEYSKSIIEDCVCNIEAMIEAQEPK